MTAPTVVERRWSEIRSTIAITLALLLPVSAYLILGDRIDHTARRAFVQSCQGNNQTRADFLAFVDSTVRRSQRALTAALRAPNTSQSQKAVAVVNLDQLKVIQHDAHEKEKAKSCAYPPEPRSP